MASTNIAPSAVTELRKRGVASKALYTLRVIAVNFLIFVAMAELISVGFVHWKKWPFSRPTYHLPYAGYWSDNNPAFGVWHPSNSHYLLEQGCFSVEYSTNSYGARDVERSVHSTQPRAIVLGDSFMEGFGIPADERFSNVLEKRTGLEHLNFSTGGGFSPLQYALLYRTMAAAFDHRYVLVGVLPGNDFHEMDGTWLSEEYSGQYRPYYKPDLSIGYVGQIRQNGPGDFWYRAKSFMAAYLASYHVGDYVYNRMLHSASGYSGYYDYSDVDMARMKNALQDIKSTADAHGASMRVFVIPTAKDFERLHKEGRNRLGPALESWGSEAGIPVKDLMPEMEARSHGNERDYFLPCDGHWSAHGASVAADIVQQWVYPGPGRTTAGASGIR